MAGRLVGLGLSHPGISAGGTFLVRSKHYYIFYPILLILPVFSFELSLCCDWSFLAVFFMVLFSGEGLAFLPGVPVVGGLGFPARGSAF